VENTTEDLARKPAGSALLSRLAAIGFGLVLGVEVLLMGLAGSAKFTNAELWTGIFEGFGYPPAMAYLVGAAEMIGVLLLLVPRLSSWTAMGLAVIMLGALQAVLTHPNDLGATTPIIHIALLALIGTVRWKRRWRARKQ